MTLAKKLEKDNDIGGNTKTGQWDNSLFLPSHVDPPYCEVNESHFETSNPHFNVQKNIPEVQISTMCQMSLTNNCPKS